MLSLLSEPSGAVGQRENGQIIAQIAKAPKLREEAASALPALEAALNSPAAPEAVAMIMAARAPTYGLNFQDKSPEEWTLLAGPYLAVLAEFSPEVIEAGFLAWDRGEVVGDAIARGFFPRPAQLHDGCVKARAALAAMRWRCKRAAEWGPPKPAEPRQRMTREEMIAAGWMTPEGKIVGLGGGAMHTPPTPAGPLRPRPGSPQQVAEGLRHADADARRAGVPINQPRSQGDDEVIL